MKEKETQTEVFFSSSWLGVVSDGHNFLVSGFEQHFVTSYPAFAGHTQDSIGDPQESNTYPTLNVRSKLGIFKFQIFLLKAR